MSRRPEITNFYKEISKAKEEKLYSPTSGLPDFDAIKEVFGLSPGDLQTFNRPEPSGKKIPRYPGADDMYKNGGNWGFE